MEDQLMTFKIKLKRDLPVEKKHGAFKDKVFKAWRFSADPRIPNYCFVGEADEKVHLFDHEFENLEEGRAKN